MDILTLKSVVSTSQGAIYCNLSILNSDSEIISTGIANFTNGNNIQIDFRDSGDDDNDDDDDDYNYDMWLPNSAEWFNISISDCTEICMIDVGEVSDSEFSSYQATPSNFMYQASFRHVDQILSEDPFDNAELSSRLISLSKLQASAFVIAKEKIKVKSVAMTNLKTEILSDLSTFTCTSFSEIGDNQLGIGENKSAANDLPGNRSKVGAIRIQFSDIEALLCALLLIVSVISGLKKVVSAVTFNGTLSHSRSCIEESLNQSNTDQLHNDEIQNTDTSSEQHQQDKVPKPSAAEEYYSMIENASESVSADYATWGHDTESESELSTINDVLNSRSRTASSDISHYKVDSVTGVPELISTDNFVPYSVSANEIGPLDSIASGCAKSASVFTSVDLVELAFLADWKELVLTNPGRDPSYDNCTTTLDSQPISPCPSGDDKMFTGFQEMTNAARLTTPMLDGSNLYSVPEVTRPAAVDDNQSILEVRVPVQDLSLCVSEDVKPSTELVELEISELLMSENLCDLSKKSDPTVTGVRTGNSDDSILKVDVSMSPQSLQRATQTCLTPGEWQSVNDMPRMNRTPYTNQTQRITPLKEKVRRSKQRNHVQYADNAVEGFNYNGVADSVSSNCSTVSTTLSFNNSNPEAKSSKGTKYETMMISSAGCPLDNCRDVIAGSNRERVQDCQHYFKTGTMIDGDDGNLEEEENAACNFSDISSRDELFIDSTAYLDLQHSTEGRTLDSKIFDGSVRNLNDICGKLNLSQIYNESDTDSDNDLGHFYAPSPLSKRCNSEDRLGPSSLGYISSYPSVVSKSIN